MRTLLLIALVLVGPVAVSASPDSERQVVITKVATGYRFTEGPAVDAQGNVFFTDIPNQRVHRFDPRTSKVTVHLTKSGGANGLMFDARGRLLACEGKGRRLVRHGEGGVEVLAERFGGKRLNSPNDLTLDAHGGVYFTDPRYGQQADRELDHEGVYYRSADGTLTRVAKEITKPNGILLSRDGRHLYIAASKAKQVMVYGVTKPGVLGLHRLFAGLDAAARGGPDGLALDPDGNVYCAGQGQVWIWNAKGVLQQRIKMPENPTNCILGREQAWTLYVTARTSFYRLTRAPLAKDDATHPSGKDGK